MMNPSNHVVRARRGFTMAEVIASTILVGVVLVAALQSLEYSTQLDLQLRTKFDGPVLADMLLAEIVALPFEDPDGGTSIGPDTGETTGTRSEFDDVDDYHRWSLAPASKSGVPLVGYESWTVSVAVQHCDPTTGQPWSSGASGLKRIVVASTDPAGRITFRTGYRSQTGVLEQPPLLDQTVVSEVQATLAIGDGDLMRMAVNLNNHVEAPDGI